MRKHVLPLFVAAIAAASQPCFGEDAKAEVMALIGDISDKRTTGNFAGECEVELKFTGDIAAEAQGVGHIRITEATDDTGRKLLNDDKESWGAEFDTDKKKSIKLKNPSRNAKVIRTLVGEAEFLNPTVENGGRVIVPNFMKEPGKTLESPALAKEKIEIAYLTQEAYEAKKKQLQEEQKKKAGEAGQKMAEAFGEMFGGFFGGGGGDPKKSIQLYVNDPEKRVLDITYLDKDGKRFDTMSRMTSGTFRTISFRQAPPPDLQLVVLVSTKESLKKASFKVENIPLP